MVLVFGAESVERDLAGPDRSQDGEAGGRALGDLLRALRGRAGLTQEELGTGQAGDPT